MELSPTEITTLEIFTSDIGAFEVVHKIAHDRIERARDTFIRTLSSDKTMHNDSIGAKIRAFDEGMLLVDAVFKEIGSYRKQPERSTKNPAK